MTKGAFGDSPIKMKFEQAEKLSDEELVKLTLSNQDYFLFIIHRYKIRLFNYIRRVTNISYEDAEDILQDVFIKIYFNLNDFAPDLKFSSWVYAIARNQAISNYRKLRSRAEGHKTDFNDDIVNDLVFEIDINKNIDAKFLKENVQKILSSMNGKYREVLVLKFLEDKSYQEISDIIKKPSGTVGSMINKAKKIFRDKLNNI
ncbi:MAG: RNA polymerase sigma factor [bacterium]